jgi:hypothetical protein
MPRGNRIRDGRKGFFYRAAGGARTTLIQFIQEGGISPAKAACNALKCRGRIRKRFGGRAGWEDDKVESGTAAEDLRIIKSSQVTFASGFRFDIAHSFFRMPPT